MTTKPAASDPSHVSEDSSIEDILKFIQKNRNILIASAVVILIVVLVSVFYSSSVEKNEQEAWFKFSEAQMQDLDSLALTGVLDEIKGTSAEPWLLYFLSIKQFKEEDLEAAKETYQRLESEFAHHYILSNNELAPAFGEKLNRELEWISQHPLPLEIEETAPSDTETLSPADNES